MWLAIDVGNSNLVVGIFEDAAEKASRPLRSYRLSTYPLGTADELRARLHSVLALSGVMLDDDTPIVAASVVPLATRLLLEAFPQQVRIIDSNWPFSFRVATENPAQTGIDRLVNAEAIAREKRAPAIIVDAGTATTICALAPGRDGLTFLGGAILPGIAACRDALPAKAAQLFPVELAAPERAIGRSTTEALQSGVVLGYASMIDGMIERFVTELQHQSLPERPRVIATGGFSRLLREHCTRIDELDPDLTLKGIAYLHASRTR